MVPNVHAGLFANGKVIKNKCNFRGAVLFFFVSGPNQGRQRANVLLLSISNGPENKWNEIVKISSLFEREALFGRAQADLGPCR